MYSFCIQRIIFTFCYIIYIYLLFIVYLTLPNETLVISNIFEFQNMFKNES